MKNARERNPRQAGAPQALSQNATDEAFSYNDPDNEDAPPLRGKVHPRSEINDVVPTLDDEVRRYHHHPNDAGSIEFETNPDAADAAADLASDLGSEFLEGATRGQDISELAMLHDDSDGELPYLLEDDDLDAPASGIEEEDQPATERSRRRPDR
jgi:hypothetical protein